MILTFLSYAYGSIRLILSTLYLYCCWMILYSHRAELERNFYEMSHKYKNKSF